MVPEGVAASGIQVGSLTTQTDVKNRWPDGSIKFAVVSVKVPAGGRFPLTSATAPTNTFSPVRPDIAVTFTINGIVWTARAGAFSPANSWPVGPVVRETRATVVPANGSAVHPQLEVVFDIRSDQAADRIDFTVQNVRDLPTMDKVVASNVSLTVNGTAVWTHGAVTTYSMTRWRHVEWTGGAEAAITPDFEPMYQAGTMPRVDASVPSLTYNLSSPNYDLMGGPPAGGSPATDR